MTAVAARLRVGYALEPLVMIEKFASAGGKGSSVCRSESHLRCLGVP